MTRPDLEALAMSEMRRPGATVFPDDVHKWISVGDLRDFAAQVAAHERARTIAAIRAKADDYLAVPLSHYRIAAYLLQDLADDLEVDK